MPCPSDHANSNGIPAASPEELLRLRLAVEASGEMVFMTDADGTITYVNPEFVRVYGYAPSELVGRSTPRLLKGGATSTEEYDSFWQQLRDRQVVKREFANRTKAGTTVMIESSANPILLNDELVGFLAVQRDVTARKATEAALRESEARYRTLAEAAHDSIFIVDSDGRIEYANAMCLSRFGLEGADSIGRNLHEVFPADVAAEMWRELAKVFTTGQRQYSEHRFNSATGDLWLGTWVVPMSRETADIQAVMGVARDITERKRLEREFAQAQKMEAVGRLAGGVAHDFNNLLTAILGYSDLLLDNLRHDPNLFADLNEIKKAGERASRLTSQLLTFSRKQPFSPTVLDLNVVIGDLQKMLARVIGEDLLLEIVTHPALALCRVDASQMEQLIVNLVVNARDAMPRGGSLRIATSNVELGPEFVRHHDGAVAGHYVALSVQDSGCGIDADVLAHVFEPFFTTKPDGKGTGLGLSTVYGIVKQSGGYITIDSEPGLGTTVTTYLPVALEAGPGPVTTAAVTRVLSGTETILLAEDEPALRRLMQRTLQQCGYTVLNAQSAADAIAVSERHPGAIDLLLSDVVMPGLSGPDLAQRIVRLRPAIKVLYVSGFTSHALFQGGSVDPGTCFLGKPFTRQVLAAKVRECLDRKGERREAVSLPK